MPLGAEPFVVGLLLTAAGILVSWVTWRAVKRRRRIAARSVSGLIRQERRGRLGLGKVAFMLLLARETLSRSRASLVTPSPVAVAASAGVVLCAVAIEVVLGTIHPPGRINGDFATVYTTLWQAQTALAGLALPILVFIIELAKDDTNAFAPTSEVLVRRTIVFPSIAFVLLSSAAFVVGAYWFPGTVTYIIGAALLAGAVGLTLLAYYRALTLLFQRTTLKRASTDVLTERFTASIDRHARVRMGANLVLRAAERLGVRYSAIGPRRQDSRFLVLEAPKAGFVIDLNAHHLEEFLKLLPWKAGASPVLAPDRAGATPPAEVEPTDDIPAVTLLRVYGDRVYEADRRLLALRRDAFDALDKAELQRRLSAVFTVGEEAP